MKKKDIVNSVSREFNNMQESSWTQQPYRKKLFGILKMAIANKVSLSGDRLRELLFPMIEPDTTTRAKIKNNITNFCSVWDEWQFAIKLWTKKS